MVLTLVFGGRVQESTVLAAESTRKRTIDIMEHGDTEREAGRFLLASVKRIPNQDRRGAGLDRPKLTLTPLRTTFILVLLLTNGHALSAIRYELKYLLRQFFFPFVFRFLTYLLSCILFLLALRYFVNYAPLLRAVCKFCYSLLSRPFFYQFTRLIV